MRIRLIPSHIRDPKGLQPLTAFLIDDAISVDAGSLGIALAPEDLRCVRNVILTHAHLDHIATLPIFISEVFPHLDTPICLFATKESIALLRQHIFNDQIWPDFARIMLPNGNGAGIRFMEIEPGIPFKVGGYRFTAVQTNHTIPTVGLAIEEEHAAVLLTSDTYVTDGLWQLANQLENLRAIFVDVSFPNELGELARVSKHLTPEKLDGELRKLDRAVPVFAIHMKPPYAEQISRQLHALGRSNLFIGEIDREYQFPDTWYS